MYACTRESKLYGGLACKHTKSKKILLSARMRVISGGKPNASAQYQESKQSMANMTHAHGMVAD
jgi:hypothetical protein